MKLLICKDEITKTRMKIETTDCQGALLAIMDNAWRMLAHVVINDKA